MRTELRIIETAVGPCSDSELPDLGGLRLRIFDVIEDGFGVVAITGDDAGSHLLKRGEVAVYDEHWRDGIALTDFQLQPGLYCIEHQRTRHGAPADSRRRVEREVVMVFPDPRKPECWAYRALRSRPHRGVRLPARTEGPLYAWALPDLLLGPIVGIYRPNLTSEGLNQ